MERCDLDRGSQALSFVGDHSMSRGRRDWLIIVQLCRCVVKKTEWLFYLLVLALAHPGSWQ